MLLDRVAGIISRYNMWAPGARVAVAVSGGADSVCLLHALVQLSSQWNLKLGVAHLNHSLRGAESDADEAFVRDLASNLGLSFHAVRKTFPAVGNLEENAREARYEFHHGLLASGAYDRIATGHTASDQAETVLFRLLRGAFTAGLSGIRPVRSPGIVRPLLFEPRSEIIAFLRGRDLRWREDSSNIDERFDRNRIRHKLIPQLESDWNPNIEAILARHGELSFADEDYWQGEIDRQAASVLKRTGDAVIADAKAIRELHPAVRRRVIRRALALVRQDLRELSFSHVEDILRICDDIPHGHARVQVPDVDVMRSFDLVRFSPINAEPRVDFDLPVSVPGRVQLPFHGSEIRLEVVGNSANDTIGMALCEPALRGMAGQLRVRNWRPGDRYRPAGRETERKIKELFQQFRVPLWERRYWPVLVAGDRILWSRRFGAAEGMVPSGAAAVQIREVMLESERAAPASV